MRTILARLALLALAACAAPQWEKPGASEAAVNEAMQECRVQGSLSPQPHAGKPAARSGGTAALDRIEDRHAREGEQFEKCMQDKGFSLKR